MENERFLQLLLDFKTENNTKYNNIQRENEKKGIL